MKYTSLILSMVFLLPNIATAQELTQQMTCEQAVAEFEKNGVVYEERSGQALPIRKGTPIQQANLLKCETTGNEVLETMVVTKDNPQCAIARYCD